MSVRLPRILLLASAALFASSSPAWGQAVHFSTGSPDGLIGTASQPGGGGQLEIETADDFALTQETVITNGTFTGLLPANTDVASIGNVVVEIYRVFPLDSANPPSPTVPTRANSPSDVALTSFDESLGQLVVSTSTLASNFNVANSVVNGINPVPSEFTGGEGPVSGQEVLFSFTLSSDLDLAAGHYFFVPQVQLADGNFLWLSAPRPIVAPGTPFPLGVTDLQTWIRNGNLEPNWLRIGTDITHQGPFNAAFSLDGTAVPEPATWLMMLTGFSGLGIALRWRRRRRIAAA
jgi:hypothetical protein